ncbi:hypothetical protein KSF73_05410 [Burkholderiaceae bacterium DAT-1]|nr:hypothetical protein [Burkholderiaceae bacterium DAT-1]
MHDPIGFFQIQALRLCHLLGQRRDITIMPELDRDIPPFLRKAGQPGSRLHDIRWQVETRAH